MGWKHFEIAEGTGIFEATDLLVTYPGNVPLGPVRFFLVVLPLPHRIDHSAKYLDVVTLVQRLVRNAGPFSGLDGTI